MFVALVLVLCRYSVAAEGQLTCSSTSHPSDCAALSHVYNSVYFAQNSSRLPWANGSFVCSRQFVRCDDDNFITELDLHNLGLAGSIPAEIALLVRPRSLYLYANELSGGLPPGICSLTTLEDLDVSQNLLGGELPSEIGNLTSLTYLGFSYNKFTGSLPASIGRMSKLRTLKGDYNQIGGQIPSSVGSLQSLIYFVLAYNQLVGPVPHEVLMMTSLFDLELHNNYLTSLPPDMSSLKKLTSLSVGFNAMSGSIPKLPISLVGLFVEHNFINGTIPTDLYLLSELKQLELDHNALSGKIPETIGWMPNLETLHLNDNHLTGELPTNFGGENFSNVGSLFVEDNQITSPIPSAFSHFACALANKSTDIQCIVGHNNFTKRDCLDNPCLVQACGMSC